MNSAVSTLFQAFIDSFRPKMLALTLISVSIAALFWLLLIWFSVEPLYNAALALLNWLGMDMTVYAGTEPSMLSWLKFIIVPIVVFGFMWPIVATSAVLLAGLYVTPPVLNYLAQRDFSGLEKRGKNSIVRGLWVAIRATVVFLVLWVITFPLWIIPGMAFVLPIVLTAQLLLSVMRHDALADHATVDEMKLIKKGDSSGAWLIGIVCAFLSFIPPVLLIMPVMSALAFTRHYLSLLNHIRSQHDRTIEHTLEPV
ncbi:EI24 domain-containing protein [Limnobacter humi]|uniref:EI24 domain-containing protein n=1 Tax=Limnobacter humi TaxID=1778671 RepID=A0ABT1WEZ6_9BURK|nr:EI24 domain-containing protein [Limnobacter humi]MCQ8896095.1 EI24 domain-containing protein [Limnobacter humi]